MVNKESFPTPPTSSNGTNSCRQNATRRRNSSLFPGAISDASGLPGVNLTIPLTSLMYPWSSGNEIITNDVRRYYSVRENRRTIMDILDEAIEISEEIALDLNGDTPPQTARSEVRSRRSSSASNSEDIISPQDSRKRRNCQQ